MYYDSHIHSTHSVDGKSSIQEYSALIDNGKLKGAGFAEHLDFIPECGSYDFLDSVKYLEEVKNFKDKGYELYAGVEIDYISEVEEDIYRHLKEYKYDFSICSVHMIDKVSISDRVKIPSITDRSELFRYIEKYYDELKLSLKFGNFDVIGHIGVFKRHLGDIYYIDDKIQNYVDEVENEIARLCAFSDKILEVNTSGLFSKLARTLPDKVFLKKYLSYGGRRVCLGSDAHKASDACKGFDMAYEILRETGFDYIMLPWDRENGDKI